MSAYNNFQSEMKIFGVKILNSQNKINEKQKIFEQKTKRIL